MARSRRPADGPVAPAVDPPVLGELDPGAAGDLGPRASLFERSYTDLDLDGVDLTRGLIEGCALTDLRWTEPVLNGLHLVECVLEGWDAPSLPMPRASWRDVVLRRSRLGAIELYESELRSVRIEGSKLGFLNLRGAKLQDVELVGCRIDELDLGGASVRRLALRDCSVQTLSTAGAELRDVDLRGAELHSITDVGGLAGAWVDTHQLSLLAPLLAAHVGLRVA